MTRKQNKFHHVPPGGEKKKKFPMPHKMCIGMGLPSGLHRFPHMISQAEHIHLLSELPNTSCSKTKSMPHVRLGHGCSSLRILDRCLGKI